MTPGSNILVRYKVRRKGMIKIGRMSEKKKQELAFFLNDKNRITYCEKCRKCTEECKQSFRAMVVACPNYHSKRALGD